MVLKKVTVILDFVIRLGSRQRNLDVVFVIQNNYVVYQIDRYEVKPKTMA